jgi:hypothetical protein
MTTLSLSLFKTFFTLVDYGKLLGFILLCTTVYKGIWYVTGYLQNATGWVSTVTKTVFKVHNVVFIAGVVVITVINTYFHVVNQTTVWDKTIVVAIILGTTVVFNTPTLVFLWQTATDYNGEKEDHSAKITTCLKWFSWLTVMWVPMSVLFIVIGIIGFNLTWMTALLLAFAFISGVCSGLVRKWVIANKGKALKVE